VLVTSGDGGCVFTNTLLICDCLVIKNIAIIGSRVGSAESRAAHVTDSHVALVHEGVVDRVPTL
jgi:hypothetical protein